VRVVLVYSVLIGTKSFMTVLIFKCTVT